MQRHKLRSALRIAAVGGIAATMCAALLAILARPQREAISLIEAAGGYVLFDGDLPDGDAREDACPLRFFWRRRVTSVVLKDCEQVSNVVPHLTSIRGIDRLDLEHSDITDNDLVHLEELDGLRELNLARTSVGDEGSASMSCLSHMEFLDLYGTKITDRALMSLGTLTNLKRLNLGRTAITDAGLHHIEHLENLRSIDLSDTVVSDRGLKSLGTLTALRDARVIRTCVTARGIDALCKSLRSLEMVQLSIGLSDVVLMRSGSGWSQFTPTHMEGRDDRDAKVAVPKSRGRLKGSGVFTSSR